MLNTIYNRCDVYHFTDLNISTIFNASKLTAEVVSVYFTIICAIYKNILTFLVEMQCDEIVNFFPSTNFHLFEAAECRFPDPALPIHFVDSMLKALKMNSEEARLKFPRLLQIIEFYSSETMDLMAKEVR